MEWSEKEGGANLYVTGVLGVILVLYCSKGEEAVRRVAMSMCMYCKENSGCVV